jgi:hypothetical protein
MPNVKYVADAVITVRYTVIISANTARPLTATFFGTKRFKIILI